MTNNMGIDKGIPIPTIFEQRAGLRPNSIATIAIVFIDPIPAAIIHT